MMASERKASIGKIYDEVPPSGLVFNEKELARLDREKHASQHARIGLAHSKTVELGKTFPAKDKYAPSIAKPKTPAEIHLH